MVARGRRGYSRDRITQIVGLKAVMVTFALICCAAYTQINQPTTINVSEPTITTNKKINGNFLNDVVESNKLQGQSRKLLKVYASNHDDDEVVWSKDNINGSSTCRSADQVLYATNVVYSLCVCVLLKIDFI